MLSRTSIRYARNGDVSIAYTVFGDGPVDVLFIGGFVSHLEIGLELARAERFWERIGSFARVITFDKRGMGLSDRDGGAYSIENIVDDALTVLDACEVERAAVLGVSEGGSAATLIAATHPERVSAMVQYGTYARVSRADDYPEGIPVEVVRRFWSQMIEQWGDPVSIDMWAPSAAHAGAVPIRRSSRAGGAVADRGTRDPRGPRGRAGWRRPRVPGRRSGRDDRRDRGVPHRSAGAGRR